MEVRAEEELQAMQLQNCNLPSPQKAQTTLLDTADCWKILSPSAAKCHVLHGPLWTQLKLCCGAPILRDKDHFSRDTGDVSGEIPGERQEVGTQHLLRGH